MPDLELQGVSSIIQLRGWTCTKQIHLYHAARTSS